MFNLGLFEDPYLDIDETVATVGSPELMELGYNAQVKSVVMLKNENNVISAYDANAEKKTVYVPSYTTVKKDETTKVVTSVSTPSVSVPVLSQYFNVTENPEEADFAIVGMDSPDGGDLVTVCNERAVSVETGQPLVKAGKAMARDDLRVRKPAACWYRNTAGCSRSRGLDCTMTGCRERGIGSTFSSSPMQKRSIR